MDRVWSLVEEVSSLCFDSFFWLDREVSRLRMRDFRLVFWSWSSQVRVSSNEIFDSRIEAWSVRFWIWVSRDLIVLREMVRSSRIVE